VRELFASSVDKEGRRLNIHANPVSNLERQNAEEPPMNRFRFFSAVALCAGSLYLASCGHDHDHDDDHAHASKVWESVDQVIAVMQPTAGNTAKGAVTFTKAGDKIKVVADIEGLNPGQKHAMHIHQFGDITGTDGKKTGGHYNPEGHDHGLPATSERHAGDLGNLSADASGKAHYELEISNVSIAGETNPIVGRGVIIHAKQDTGGQPTGEAGARIAQGVIGVAFQAK